MPLELESYELPPIGTQCYVLKCQDSQRIAVFDAPMNAWPTVEKIAVETGYTIAGLYLTHGHWDHTLDAVRFKDAGIPLYGHAADKNLFEYPDTMAAYMIPGLQLKQLFVDHWLEHGETINILGREVQIRHVPGHSEGSILFWFEREGFAISGDVLFQGSVGRTDFPGCSSGRLAESIRDSLYTLPPETRVLPGHGPATTVGEEMATNPFVRAIDEGD
jgi:hydroxyacylglutathione hydrolase